MLGKSAAADKFARIPLQMRREQVAQHQEHDVVVHHVLDGVVPDAIDAAVGRQPERDHYERDNCLANEPNKSLRTIHQGFLPGSEEEGVYLRNDFSIRWLPAGEELTDHLVNLGFDDVQVQHRIVLQQLGGNLRHGSAGDA